MLRNKKASGSIAVVLTVIAIFMLLSYTIIVILTDTKITSQKILVIRFLEDMYAKEEIISYQMERTLQKIFDKTNVETKTEEEIKKETITKFNEEIKGLGIEDFGMEKEITLKEEEITYDALSKEIKIIKEMTLEANLVHEKSIFNAKHKFSFETTRKF